MQIHIQLIPISSPDQIPAGPDPPENIFHYTTGLKLRSIINSRSIKPTTAKIEPRDVEQPSTQTRPCRAIEAKLGAHRIGRDAVDHVFAVTRSCDPECLVAGQGFGEQKTQNSDEQGDADRLQKAAGQCAAYSAHRIASNR